MMSTAAAPVNGEVPTPTEPYQLKLHQSFAQIPYPSWPEGTVGKIQPTEQTAVISGKPHLGNPTKDQVAAAKGDQNHPSTIVNNAYFRKLTNWSHGMLLDQWLIDGTTTCNSFCQQCGNTMGCGDAIKLGGFDVLDQLLLRGLGHVWVPADGNAKPEYGDIFRIYAPASVDHNNLTINHMGASLHVNGTDWYTVEGGQAGRGNGFDAVLRKKRNWKPSGLRGWVSIRALLAAGKPLPSWLGGWWKIEEDPYDTYYYYFSNNGKVTFSSSPPLSITAPPVGGVVGSFALDEKNSQLVKIFWHDGDVPETLSIYIQLPKDRKYILKGKTARGVDVTATRLIMKDKFG